MKELQEIAATHHGKAKTVFEGLISKKAVLRHGVATSLEGIVGWDYVTREGDTCYAFYAAQPPLIGMTEPMPTPCPLGVRAFNAYKIDAAEAIKLFHTVNCGSGFVAMTLYWVLSPSVDEPEWHLRSELGCNVVIGANSGRIGVDDPSGKAKIPPHIIALYMVQPPSN